jgi:hypothetical protein
VEREPAPSVSRVVVWLLGSLLTTVALYVFMAMAVSGALPWWAVAAGLVVLLDLALRFGPTIGLRVRSLLPPRDGGSGQHRPSL